MDAITSGSNEATETTGGRGVSRSLVHSNPSFSFNTRRRSWTERSRAASRAMVAVVNKGAIANVWQSRAGVNWRKINLTPADVGLLASPAEEHFKLKFETPRLENTGLQIRSHSQNPTSAIYPTSSTGGTRRSRARKPRPKCQTNRLWGIPLWARA